MAKFRIVGIDDYYVIDKKNWLGIWNRIQEEDILLDGIFTELVFQDIKFKSIEEAQKYIDRRFRKSIEKIVKEIE